MTVRRRRTKVVLQGREKSDERADQRARTARGGHRPGEMDVGLVVVIHIEHLLVTVPRFFRGNDCRCRCF